MTQTYEGEYTLEEDYPVYQGYWYIVNGEPWKSDRNCTVADLMHLRAQKAGSLYVITSVQSCNVLERGLKRSPYVAPFLIGTAEELGLDLK